MLANSEGFGVLWMGPLFNSGLLIQGGMLIVVAVVHYRGALSDPMSAHIASKLLRPLALLCFDNWMQVSTRIIVSWHFAIGSRTC